MGKFKRSNLSPSFVIERKNCVDLITNLLNIQQWHLLPIVRKIASYDANGKEIQNKLKCKYILGYTLGMFLILCPNSPHTHIDYLLFIDQIYIKILSYQTLPLNSDSVNIGKLTIIY